VASPRTIDLRRCERGFVGVLPLERSDQLLHALLILCSGRGTAL
jgi:hypothetical protein